MQTAYTDETSTVLAKAWYIKYDSDAYALGPLRYKNFVGADIAVADAIQSFGEPPNEIWATGPTRDGEEYEYSLAEQTTD